MATHRYETRQALVAHGYVRENFDQRGWIEEIMSIISQYYLTKGGSLYTFGYGRDRRLCMAAQSSSQPYLSRFNENNIANVAASNHTLIVLTNGEVYGCGTQTNWVLGDKNKYCMGVFRFIHMSPPAIAVCAGLDHSLILCQDGTIFSMGLNKFGQIGHPNLMKSRSPLVIETLKHLKIIQISTGDYHSAALTNNGDLYCFGNHYFGECGVGNTNYAFVRNPTKVEMNEKVSFFNCGSNHSLLVTRSYSLYSFGQGSNGKLGHGNDDNQSAPTLVKSFKNRSVKVVTCNGGGEHSLCVDIDGRIWSFGSNNNGQCGVSDFETWKIFEPVIIEWFTENNVKILDCSACDCQSSVIDKDGNMYVFGCNQSFQLALNERKDYYVPQRLKLPENIAVKQIAMGYTHTAIVCTGDSSSE